MFSKFMSLLLAGTVLSSFSAFAVTIDIGDTETIIESGNVFNITEQTELRNNGVLGSTAGHIFYMNTGNNPYINLSGSSVLNNNIMATNGTGYSVYADPLENQRMTTQVFNMGLMDRINLYKTDSSYVVNGAPVIVDTTLYYNGGAVLEGSVLMGPNARLDNYAIMRNWVDASGSAVDSSGKAYDFNPDFSKTQFSANSIWFDRRGEVHNGLAISSSASDELMVHILDQEATITTDNIFFKQTGELYSAGIIDNKFIGAGDSVEITQGDGSVKVLSSLVRLINNPFYEINTSGSFTSHLDYVSGGGTLNKISYQDKNSDIRTIQYATDKVMAKNSRSDLTTEKMAIGDLSEFSVDMGSKVSINELSLGKEAKVNFGSSYYLVDGVVFDEKPDKLAKLSAQIEVLVEHLKEVENTDPETGATSKQVVKYTESEKRPLAVIPHRTEVSVGKMTLANDSTLTLSNMTDMDGIVLTKTDDKGVVTEIAPSVDLGDNNTMSVTGGSVNLSGLLNVKGSDNMTYFHEARKKEEIEDTMYERRKLSFISYGDYAGQLFLGGIGGKEYWSAVSSVKRSDYGNDYLGYIKDYLKFVTDLTAPTSIVDFENFKDSVITFGENGKLALNVYRRNEQISLSSDNTKLEEGATLDNEIYIRSVLPVNEEEQAILMAKTLSMEKDNSVIELNGGIISVKDLKLGDNASIKTASDVQNALFADSVTFGNNGKYETAEDFSKVVGYVNDEEMTLDVPAMTTVLSGNMTFGDDGIFVNNSLFKADKLIMGKRASIEVGDNLWVETWVDTDSEIKILPMDGKGELNGISNGLFKKEGATNVEVFSNAKNLNTIEDTRRVYNENYLLNGVNVDKIHVQSGGLLMGTFDPDVAKGDIYGNILLDSDTWVHFVGNNIKIYDPISRENGATNTLVWFDLEDSAKYDTLNTIDSDDLLIAGGVLNVHHTITAPTITLDTAGSLRVYDNLFVKANVVEYEASAANTTLFLTPRFEKIDSFGIVNLDRIILENGTFNTYHSILARGQNDGSPEGIWMGSDTTINIRSDVQTSRLIRREDQIEGVTFPIVNTTAVVDGGSLTVDLSADIDTLDIKSGTFTFKNAANGLINPTLRNMYVTNDMYVGSDATFWVNGTSDVNSGRLVVGNGYGNLTFNGSHVGLTPDSLGETENTGVMNLSSNVFIGDKTILDLRTNDTGSDSIHATGRIDLDGSTRLFVRNLKEKTDYLLMTADKGLSLPDSFDISFRWHGTDIRTSDGKNLWLSVDNITTLKEELENGNVSKNVLKIGSYISDNWDGSYGPWDEIFFATTFDNAVKGINEYMPEGYINAPQTVLRTSANFQNLAIAELDDMRQLSSGADKTGRVRKTYRRPNYYTRGRSGGDMYQPYVRSQYQTQNVSPIFRSSNRPTYRTDKGGLWAKPFYVSMTQEADKGISGYEYDAFGFAAGIDKRFGRWTWGLSGLYATGDYETDNAVIKADTDTWGVGLYGSYRPRHSAFFMNLFAAYVLNSNEAQHQIKSAKANLKADYDINAVSAGLAFGYDVEVAKSFYITPKVGFNWTRLSSDEIKEEGEAPLVMRVENPNINSLQLPVEIRLAFPVATRRFELLPELHFRYTHDFGDTDYESKAFVSGTDSFFKLDNIGMPENLFTLGGSLGLTAGPHELSGRYEYDFGDGLDSHLFNVGYKYLF